MILLHHRVVSLQVLNPGGIGLFDKTFLEDCDALMGLTKSDERGTELRVGLELLTMGSHDATMVSYGSGSLSVLEGVAATGHPSNVRVGRLLKALGPCDGKVSRPKTILTGRGKKRQTLLTEIHFRLEHSELVRLARLGLAAHLLPGPLEGAIEFLGDMHGG